VFIFSSVYLKICDLLVLDAPVIVQGQVEKDENNLKILADLIVPIDKAEERWTTSIHFHLQLPQTERDLLLKLHNVFKKYPGTCNGFIHLIDQGNTDTIFSISDQMKLKAGKTLTKEVNLLTGYDSVNTVCSAAKLTEEKSGYKNNYKKRKYHNAG